MHYESMTLDEWYKSINSIFIDRNFERHPSSIYSHLTEIIAGLGALASDKHRPGVDTYSFVPKAFAWWLALCGKHRIRSVEDMLWAKFPLVCPYCRRNPHEDDICQAYKREHSHPDWDELKVMAEKNWDTKPRTIAEWQKLFFRIYPVTANERFTTIFPRLNEEVGELAEGVRAYDITPGLFFSEAADVFAWLMKVQNKIDSDNAVTRENRGLHLTQQIANAYPGKCKECGCSICRCPSILPSTLGRIAKEVPNTIDFRDSRGPILSTSETLALFELGSRELRYRDSVVPLQPQDIQQIHASVNKLLELTDDSNKRIIQYSAAIVDAAVGIRELTETQRITNESIESLARAIASLPSEPRQVVTSFLTNIAAAPWSQLLLQMVTDLATK